MVPFAGYSMPVQYSDLSVGESHKWTREKASLFDVGHMVQHHLSGPSAPAFLELITPTAISALKPYTSTLSCLLHPKTGGIVDDTVITRLPSTPSSPDPAFYIVTNAGCRDKDLAYFSEQLAPFSEGKEITHTVLEDQGLIALQGPLSASILQPLIPSDSPMPHIDLNTLYFGTSTRTRLLLPSGALTSEEVLISRGGYTGEDGFEISIAPADTVAVTEALLASAGPENLRLAGLGARDSLRLEAGMCLYGHDLDDSTTPVEAGLSWIIPKTRRTSGGFHGAEAILPQLTPKKDGGTGVQRRRVGLTIDGAPAREGAEIVASDGEGEVIGRVTSGCPSPSLGANIAMGYVKNGFHKAGTEVGVLVRGKGRVARVVKMPFVGTRYHREWVNAG
ncbi:Aminomethyltransferase, mitochondrial [Trapelia coarctata]|nr:Aminomethyltransferase, mitochondrial [Trapelia coarctata]